MLGINSLSGKPLIPQPQCNEQKKECFTCVVDPGPFSAGCEINLSCKAGLLTRSGFDAFPVIHQWLRLSIPRVPVSGQELTAAGTVADFHGIPF